MSYLVDFWNALDLSSTTSNAFFSLLFSWGGYRAGVSWSREQLRRDRLVERKSLFDTIDFFVADCLIAMSDGEKNLRSSRPAHRAVPTVGLEYFQIQAMRHSERELFVALATLRGQADQANTLFPVIVDRFTSVPEDALAPAGKPSLLQLHCRHVIHCYDEVRKACDDVRRQTKASRERS